MEKVKHFKSYKKVRTEADIKADPRIDEFIRNYDGYGRHMVGCKTGFRLDRKSTRLNSSHRT